MPARISLGKVPTAAQQLTQRVRQQLTHAATKDAVGEHDQIPIVVHQPEHVAASGEVEPLHRETTGVDACGRVAPAVLDECIQFVGGNHGGSKRSGHKAGQRQPAAELEHTLA